MDNKIAQLTLTPDLEETKLEVQQQTQMTVPVPEAGLDMSMLTPEEQKTVKAFAQQIDITNSQQVLQYGPYSYPNFLEQ